MLPLSGVRRLRVGYLEPEKASIMKLSANSFSRHVARLCFGIFLGLGALVPTLALGAGCMEFFEDANGMYHDGDYAAPAGYAVDYVTLITDRDRVNSRGQPLDGFRAVLQQDRANVNRFGKSDSYVKNGVDANGQAAQWTIFDQKDSFFVTPQRRAMILSMPLVFTCGAFGQPVETDNSPSYRRGLDRIAAGPGPIQVFAVVVKLPRGGHGLYPSFDGS